MKKELQIKISIFQQLVLNSSAAVNGGGGYR
jgi:hypothetical protein